MFQPIHYFAIYVDSIKQVETEASLNLVHLCVCDSFVQVADRRHGLKGYETLFFIYMNIVHDFLMIDQGSFSTLFKLLARKRLDKDLAR